jgi:retron-type reverse transcriptase
MGFFDWLSRLFGPPRRDVSSLGGEDVDLEAVEEKIDLSGKPAKEHHRRRALRDKRLLPKRRTIGKKPKVMSEGEADRLFAGTMRTKNRAIRDLLPDEEQLGRLGLPIWRNEADVAAAVGISERALLSYAIHRQAETVQHYVMFAIPKRRGGERVIMAPKKRLKELQRKLLRLLVSKLPASEHAHGFITGRSIATNARPHAKKRVILTMDLVDFFPTISFARVRGLLIAAGYGYPVATSLAVLMTESIRQPVDLEGRRVFVPIGKRHAVQGAPTSPAISNAIALKMDRRLAGLAKKIGFTYTRYADDLAFSGDDPAKVARLLRHATAIIESEGFAVNAEKTRVLRRGRRQRVAGVTVAEGVGLSKKERKKIRALIHQHGKDPQRRAQIEGKLAYLHMLNPAQAASLRRRFS